ncbi:MAG: serine protease [Candidatus Micrarchaeota archaeon]
MKSKRKVKPIPEKKSQSKNNNHILILVMLVLFLGYLAYLNLTTFLPEQTNQTNQTNISPTLTQTKLRLINSNQLFYLGDNISVQIILLDSNNKPIKDANLLIKNKNIIGQESTDSNGTATFNPELIETGNYTLEIIYSGNESYNSSNLSFNISVLNSPSIYDPIDSILLSKLEKSIVIVKSPYAIGSGVIIGYEDGKTIVLTSKDIVDQVSDPTDVTVTTNDGPLPAINITFTSNGINLALVYIDAIFGSAASYSIDAILGEDVVSLAFDSLSVGIVTGLSNESTANNYEYGVIETDADIYPGAGVFSQDSENLIGIVTFDGSDLIVIDVDAINSTNVTTTDGNESVSCDLSEPECLACSYGYDQYVVINDVVYCCGPGALVLIEGVWSCQ